MIGAGETFPDALVWVEPGGQALQLASLQEDGPFLLLVYLYDWTAT